MIANDLSTSDYNALPGWRWSHIKLMDRSPLAVRHAEDTPSVDDGKYAKLRAIHSLTLEPHAFEREFAVFSGARRAGKAWDEFAASLDGRTSLTQVEYDDAAYTADKVRANRMVRDLLSAGHPEVSATWTDAATGLPCKGRMDWVGPGYIVDLKTCGTTSERQVAGMVARNLWHGQLAHYAAGLEANGEQRPSCFIIAAQGRDEQDVAVYQLDRGIPDGALHVGDGIRRDFMARLAECVRLNHWPGRHESIVPLCLPSYALGEPADELTGVDP